MRYARENDDKVFFREIVDRLSGDTCPLYVQGQAEHVILMEMKGRIGLFVKPILCDEQIVAWQRSEIIQDTFHRVMRLIVTNIQINKDKSKPGRVLWEGYAAGVSRTSVFRFGTGRKGILQVKSAENLFSFRI